MLMTFCITLRLSQKTIRIITKNIQNKFYKTSFLLTGDLESSAEPALFSFKDLLRTDVLKVGHHGSKTSSSAAFLDLIRPRLSVVSVGYRNKYFHPGKKTMARLAGMQAHPLRTDRVGAVVVQSDGRELQLLNWRKW